MKRSPWYSVLLVPAILLVGGCGSGEKVMHYDHLEAGLDSLVHHYVDANEDIHSALLLVEGPEFRWIGTAGLADPDSGTPMRPDDQFYLASTAKTLTATAVMQLVEAGKVKLDGPIASYLPGDLIAGLHVYEGHDYGSEITVRQLLNHTSGIADNWADDAFVGLIVADPEKLWQPEETIEYVKQHCPAHFPPGEGWHYSDINYNLLGLIIQAETGQSLTAVLRDSLFVPLGMANTHRHFVEDERPVEAGRATSRWYREDLPCNDIRALSADWGGGGLYSTADDLSRFMHAFVNDEIFAQPSTRAEMLKWVEAMPGVGYGFGIIHFDMDVIAEDLPAGMSLGTTWGHQGASSAFMYYWPERDIYLIGTLNQMRREGEMLDGAMQIIEASLP
jgi:D-alanyl-D-alanine carboxypeptidase